MNSRTLAVLLLAVFILGMAFTPAGASQVKKMDMDGMVKKADLIITGTVIQVKAVREANPVTGGQSIYTYVTVDLDDVLKGELKGSSYTFRVLGGEISGEPVGEKLADAPEFKMGQEVFLFLKKDPKLYSPVVGLFQGRFNLVMDKKTGHKLVYDNFGNPVTGSFFGKGDGNGAVTYDFFKATVKGKVK